MANPRVLTKRRKAVSNIRKITRTMQLIATARYQQALTQATASKPYAERITEFVEELSAAGGDVTHPLLAEHAEAPKAAVLVITSNRGLCGGYNSGLLRAAAEHEQAMSEAGRELERHVVGKKGVTYYRFLRKPLAAAAVDFPDTPGFADVQPLADGFMKLYTEGGYASIHVVYSQFISAAKQIPTCLQLLPIRRATTAEDEPAPPGRAETQYDFSPPPATLLQNLLPVTVRARLFQCFMEATVSEQVARMVAMKAATDAADEMIKLLSRQYNRARQTQITTELLDILGGAEALK